MLSKLEGVGTEMLQKIQARIGEILNSRLDSRVLPGRIATFEHNYQTHTCRVEKLNQKTASVVEITPTAGKKWRVGITQLKVAPIERKIATPLKAITAPHKPASLATVGDSW